METNGNKYDISEKILGLGVDGVVYEVIYNNYIKIAVKIMDNNFTDEELDEFITINKKMSEIKTGPLIYDIIKKDNKIYIFMEKMEYTLCEYINNLIIKKINMEKIIKIIKNQITPIHKKMKSHNITIGDKTIDNYMFKNNILKKIDFTTSKIKTNLTINDIKDYNYIHIFNYKEGLLQKIILF